MSDRYRPDFSGGLASEFLEASKNQGGGLIREIMNFGGKNELSLAEANDAMLAQALHESGNNVRGGRNESEIINLVDGDDGGGKMSARKVPPCERARSTSPAPSGEQRSGYLHFTSGQTHGNPSERPRSTSPKPSGSMRVFSRIEGTTMKNMHAHQPKEERKKLSMEHKEDRKSAKKRMKKLIEDSSKGRKEDVGRNVCQSLGVPLSQVSAYERGEVNDMFGNPFRSPNVVNAYDAINESDSDSD